LCGAFENVQSAMAVCLRTLLESSAARKQCCSKALLLESIAARKHGVSEVVAERRLSRVEHGMERH
jgi:hypothetical protein